MTHPRQDPSFGVPEAPRHPDGWPGARSILPPRERYRGQIPDSPSAGPDQEHQLSPDSGTQTTPAQAHPVLGEPTPTAEQPRRRPALRPLPLLAALIAGLIGGLGGGILSSQLPQPGNNSTQDGKLTVPVTHQGQGQDQGISGAPLTSSNVAPAPSSTSSEADIPSLARAVLPSVALITVTEQPGVVGQGSGFVIRSDGYLLTNHHVVSAAQDAQIEVELPGREPLEATIVGSDAVYDIAVLRVEEQDLPALAFADASVVEVGQTVVAVGAPLGLDSTVTSGIISAIDRPVVAGEGNELSYINAVQTDAAINPGNSGGPLLDLAGRVVGVNSAIAQLPSMALASPSGSIGLGFAIPAEQAARTAQQLIETGTSQHPIMGVHIDLDYAGEGARVLAEAREGVQPIIPGGPAEEAGVLPADVIIAVDGTRIRDAQHLLVLLRSKEVGQRIEMVLQATDGSQRTVSLVLAGSGQ